jgi:hypothetical protein
LRTEVEESLITNKKDEYARMLQQVVSGNESVSSLPGKKVRRGFIIDANMPHSFLQLKSEELIQDPALKFE